MCVISLKLQDHLVHVLTHIKTHIHSSSAKEHFTAQITKATECYPVTRKVLLQRNGGIKEPKKL